MLNLQIVTCLKGYNAKTFPSDLIVGIIVGTVALPLAIAFGIASGAGPAEGLMTAIVAGLLLSIVRFLKRTNKAVAIFSGSGWKMQARKTVNKDWKRT